MIRSIFLGTALLTASLALPFISMAQQEPDKDFNPRVANPHFKSGTGPVIMIDEGHNNFHTLQDKFSGFGKVAGKDGFRVISTGGEINQAALIDARILVIANALNEKNVTSWQQPVHQAFTAQEIKLLNDWVKNGGRLFLIADHMPFAGAVADLASSMGFTFYDGFAMRGPNRKFDMFTFSDGTLNRCELTNNGLDSIVSFTGQAFKIPANATSVITLDSNYKVLMPEIAWQFGKDTKMIPAAGLSQLAYCNYGSGKVVVSGEAAMFTAQRMGDVKFGLNAPVAKNNPQLLLNILAWLNE